MKERSKKKKGSSKVGASSIAVDRFTPDQLSNLQRLYRSGTRSPSKKEAAEILGNIGKHGRVGNLLSSNMVLEWFKAAENDPRLCPSLSEGTSRKQSPGIRTSRSNEERYISQTATNSDHLFTSLQLQLLETYFLDEPNPTQEELAGLLEKIGKEGRMKGATISVTKLTRWFVTKRDQVEQQAQQLEGNRGSGNFLSSVESSPAKTPNLSLRKGPEFSERSSGSMTKLPSLSKNYLSGETRARSLEEDSVQFSFFQRLGSLKSSPKNSPVFFPIDPLLSSPTTPLPLSQWKKSSLLLQSHNHLLSQSILSLLLSFSPNEDDTIDDHDEHIREDLMKDVLLLHGDPYGLFLCCLERELLAGSNIATIARQRTPSVRCLQFLYSYIDLGEIIEPFRKFAFSLTKAQQSLLEEEAVGEGTEGAEGGSGGEKRARLKERFLGCIWKGLCAEKLPVVVTVVCYEAEKRARKRYGEAPAALSTMTLKEWALGAFFLLRFLIPLLTAWEGGKGLFLAKFLMRLCSNSDFQGKGCLANETLREARERFKSFCISVIQRGKEAAVSFRWEPPSSPTSPSSFSSHPVSPKSSSSSSLRRECLISSHFFSEMEKRQEPLEQGIRTKLRVSEEGFAGTGEELLSQNEEMVVAEGEKRERNKEEEKENEDLGERLVRSFLKIGNWANEESQGEQRQKSRQRSKSGVEAPVSRTFSEI